MQKREYTPEEKILYKCSKQSPFFVDVPDLKYLQFDGSGHPSETDYQKACEALFTISYIIKFKVARAKFDIDFKVNPMEVTWHLDKSKPKILFTWTMMIMQPPFITQTEVTEALRIAREGGKVLEYSRIRFGTVHFGKSIQCFHRGDYNTMNDTLAKMTQFAAAHGFSCDSYTHDIYLNDMRKTKPENYKSVIRVRCWQ